MGKRTAFALCLILALTPGQAPAVVARPAPAIPLAGYVTDQAQALSPVQRSALTTKLRHFAQTTKHQMVVATVTTLGNRDIKAYTTDLFNAWGIGRKDYNDGVVVLVAPRQHQARIAVGRALEKVLTDKACSKIMQETMVPRFKNGDMYGAINAGVDALASKLQ